MKQKHMYPNERLPQSNVSMAPIPSFFFNQAKKQPAASTVPDQVPVPDGDRQQHQLTRAAFFSPVIVYESLAFPDMFVSSSVTRSNNRNLRPIA